MSINYKHPVDVPVTDMDDPDDDIIFHDSLRANPHRLSTDFLDDLDYEPRGEPTFTQKISSFFQGDTNEGASHGISLGDRFSKAFNWGDQPELYEMLDRNKPGNDSDPEPSTPSETGSESADPVSAIVGWFRERQRARAEKLTKKKIAFAVLVLVFAVMGFFGGVLVMTDHYKGETVQLNAGSKRILTNSTHEFYPTTIVVLLDGFHPHYISPKVTPTLHKMFVHDFGAPYMVPSFPSSTFPNHWTLVTGLYPSEHGIVGNTFFDPVLDKQFINTNPKVGGLDPDFWQGGEPLWTTASRQGVKSAVHMWPGSEVPGVGPAIDYDLFNGSEVLSAKVDRVMGWLDRKLQDRPELILTYVPTTDQYGHKYGISGPELESLLTYVDNFVQLLRTELAMRNLQDVVNLVVVSDHGMAPTLDDRLVYLDDMIDMSKLSHVDGWPLFGLRPAEGHLVDELYDELALKLEGVDEVLLYKVEDMPREWNFGRGTHRFDYRLAPLWLIPHVGYAITTHKQMEANGGHYKPKGVHGYNNTELLMRAIFLGTGPYFNERLKDGSKVPPFANTEVYNIVCESLDLEPAPNNGTGVINNENVLSDTWTDMLVFPGLGFAVDHIVQEDATYDLLFRSRKAATTPTTVGVSTNSNAKGSMVSKESKEGNKEGSSATQSATKEGSGATLTKESSDSSLTKESSDSSLTKESSGATLSSATTAPLEGWFESQLDTAESFLDDVGNSMKGWMNSVFGGWK